MTKDRLTVSLDPENARYLGRDDINASGLVNKLVEEHRHGGVGSDYLRELREEQVKAELDSLKARLDAKENELEELQSEEERQESQRSNAVRQRLEDLENVRVEVTEDHVSVEGLARQEFNGDTTAALNAMQEMNDEDEIVPEEYL